MKYSILYFASLADKARCAGEQWQTSTQDARQLYAELAVRHGFALGQERLRIAVNGVFARWEHTLEDNDEIAFLPPVSGG